MELHECHLDKDRDEKFEYIEIKPVSDWHLDDPNCDKGLIKSDIDFVNEKENRFMTLTGDIMGCTTTHSVSNSYESQMTPHMELKQARKMLSPVKDKVLASIMGNHERRIYRNDGMDVAEELARELGCYYSKEGMVLKVKFGERKSNQKPQVYTLYLSHGFTGSRTTGGKANRLDKLRNIVVTDVYIVSHSHQKISFNKDIFMPDMRNNKITRKKQTFINTGAYLDYGGYGEVKAYDPTDLGTVTLRLYAGEKNIEVII